MRSRLKNDAPRRSAPSSSKTSTAAACGPISASQPSCRNSSPIFNPSEGLSWPPFQIRPRRDLWWSPVHAGLRSFALSRRSFAFFAARANASRGRYAGFVKLPLEIKALLGARPMEE